jgi:hypothetical protein
MHCSYVKGRSDMAYIRGEEKGGDRKSICRECVKDGIEE